MLLRKISPVSHSVRRWLVLFRGLLPVGKQLKVKCLVPGTEPNTS